MPRNLRNELGHERLAQDLRCITRQQYSRAVELTTSIGKQAGGWRRASASPAS